MPDKNNLVKKESVVYALVAGLIAGFIGGAVFAVYKLGPETEYTNPQETSTAASAQAQLDNQTTEAIKNLEAEVTANPDNVEAWTRLGHFYFDTDQVKNAIKAYERSLELLPGNADVLTDLGVMYRRDKQPQKAVETFEHAYSIQPNHAQSRLNNGIVLLYDLDKPEEAIAVWEELLAIDPNARMNTNLTLEQAIINIKEQMKAKKQQ